MRIFEIQVLDAPELQDDFYLNLVDWSSQNMLSVGLNTCVYLWSACNSQVNKLSLSNNHKIPEWKIEFRRKNIDTLKSKASEKYIFKKYF